MTAKSQPAATPEQTATPQTAQTAPAGATSAKARKTTSPKSTPARTVPAKAAAPQRTDAEAAQAEGEEADEEVPMNRAARRAKGRGKAANQVAGVQAKVSGGHGPAHTQRNWASRRSG